MTNTKLIPYWNTVVGMYGIYAFITVNKKYRNIERKRKNDSWTYIPPGTVYFHRRRRIGRLWRETIPSP